MLAKLPSDLIVRSPNLEEAQVVYELITNCYIAEYTEPDTTFGDLMDEWSDNHH